VVPMGGLNKTWAKILSKYFQGHYLVNHIDVKWIRNKTVIQLYYGKAVIIIDIVTMLLFSTFYHCYKHTSLSTPFWVLKEYKAIWYLKANLDMK